jgi:hypothetical protein
MLDQALAYGMRKVSVIRLWDRQEGDGPGGTKHLHDAVVLGSGKAYVIDTTVSGKPLATSNSNETFLHGM